MWGKALTMCLLLAAAGVALLAQEWDSYLTELHDLRRSL